jgi:hypothetical protein
MQRAQFEKLLAHNRAGWADPLQAAVWKAKRRVRSPKQRAHATKLVALMRDRWADPVWADARKAEMRVRSPKQRAQLTRLHAHNRARDPVQLADWKAKLLATVERRRPVTLEDWLRRDVEPEPTSGCWLWIGPHTPEGYGRAVKMVDGRWAYFYAHRLIYEVAGYVLPQGSQLHHRCSVRTCVNPLHLQPLTPSEHSRITARQLPDLDLTCQCGQTRGVFAAACCSEDGGA